MNKEILYEILNSKSETLSSAEIENIMNEELDKSTQDMDTDLIDLCLEALNTVDEEKLNKRKKKYRFGRMMVVAAIFIVIIGITIPVCAKYLSINVPEGIVTLYEECFHIDISPDIQISDITKQFEQNGLDNIVLPEVVFDENTVISNYSYTVDSNISTSCFDFKNNDVIGRITIEKYNDFVFFNGQGEMSADFENIEYLNCNDIEVLVFSKDNLSYINYCINEVRYNIVLHSDFDAACKIAESI